MSGVTRDELLKRIPTGSPYEAVIVAAREARRMNRARLSRLSLLGPGPQAPSPSGPAVSEESPFPPPEVPVQEGEAEAAVEAAVARPVPPGGDQDEPTKVTMSALERLSRGEVTYEISEGPVDPEED